MLPEKYKWLEEIGTLPKLVSAALQYYGVKEIKGAKSNPVILDMARGIGCGDIYTQDDTSWCAVFINHLIRITGKPPVDYKNDRYNLLRAKWLLNWGNAVKKGDEQLGDIMVFDREGGGHVGILIAHSETSFHILGGNQSDSVNIIELAKNRLIGARRYYATKAPESAKQYVLNSSGQLSTNEA